jgi:hypothetical protein
MPNVLHEPPAAASRAPTLHRVRSDDAEPARPSGPAAASVLAAGLAAFALGILSVLATASAGVTDALALSERVGEVSGLTTTAALVFFGSWGALALAWRRADPPLLRVAAAAALLVALGLLGTFPPFLNLFG